MPRIVISQNEHFIDNVQAVRDLADIARLTVAVVVEGAGPYAGKWIHGKSVRLMHGGTLGIYAGYINPGRDKFNGEWRLAAGEYGTVAVDIW